LLIYRDKRQCKEITISKKNEPFGCGYTQPSWQSSAPLVAFGNTIPLSTPCQGSLQCSQRTDDRERSSCKKFQPQIQLRWQQLLRQLLRLCLSWRGRHLNPRNPRNVHDRVNGILNFTRGSEPIGPHVEAASTHLFLAFLGCPCCFLPSSLHLCAAVDGSTGRERKNNLASRTAGVVADAASYTIFTLEEQRQEAANKSLELSEHTLSSSASPRGWKTHGPTTRHSSSPSKHNALKQPLRPSLRDLRTFTCYCFQSSLEDRAESPTSHSAWRSSQGQIDDWSPSGYVWIVEALSLDLPLVMCKAPVVGAAYCSLETQGKV
jgi:hypothetical protein